MQCKRGEKNTCCTMNLPRAEINRLAGVLSTETMMAVYDCRIWSVAEAFDNLLRDKYIIIYTHAYSATV